MCGISETPLGERPATSHYATLHMTSVMLSSTLRMEIEAIAVALHREDDAGKGG
jgi:hypothetical protein